MKCTSCNKSNTYEIDDIRAVDYSLGELIKNRIAVFLILLVVTFALGFFLIGPLGGVIIAVVTSLISIGLLRKNSSAKNLTFNKHKVKGRMTSIAS